MRTVNTVQMRTRHARRERPAVVVGNHFPLSSSYWSGDL